MHPEIDRLLTDATHEVEQLRTRLSEGVASDIKTLDPKLTALMSALKAAPHDVGRAYSAALQELGQSLSELQSDFHRQQTSAAEGLQQINNRFKAATAYAKSAAATESR